MTVWTLKFNLFSGIAFFVNFRQARLHQKYWNKGFATETAKRCLVYGFEELGLKKIVGRAMKENVASIKVLEKLGMTFQKVIDFDGEEGAVYEIYRERNSQIAKG